MKKLYEDEMLEIVMPEKAATKGHLQVIPKSKAKSLGEMSNEEAEHLFFASSYAATALFELLQAQGSNILIKNFGDVNVDVIARNADDGLNLLWTPKKAEPAELDEVAAKIKGKADYIGVEKVEKKPLNMDKKESVEDTGEINYLIRSLRRIP